MTEPTSGVAEGAPGRSTSSGLSSWEATSGSRRQSAYAVLLCVLFSLGVGASFGAANHNSYLVHGLACHDPRVLSEDWLVQTTTHHRLFTFVAWALFACNSEGYGFVALALLSSFSFAWGVWLLVNEVASRHSRTIFLLSLWSCLVLIRYCPAGTYLLADEFQPGTIGAVGLVFSIALYLRGAFLSSGFVLACTGAFHLNFLVLGVLAFLTAHFLVGEPRLGRRVGVQLAFPVLAICLFLPTLLAHGAGEGAPEARLLLQELRAPHHYRPPLQGFLGFVAWHLLAAPSLDSLRRSSAPGRRLFALVVVLFCSNIVAAIAANVVVIPVVAQLFVWRLAPFSLLLCAVALLKQAVPHLLSVHRPLSAHAVAAVGAGFLLAPYTGARFRGVALVSFAAIAAVQRCGTSLGWSIRSSKRALQALLVLAFAFSAILSARTNQAFTVGPGSRRAVGVCNWARDSTPPESRFLTPPEMEDFRLHARRAIVVDWKSPPIKPGAIHEWLARLQAVSGGIRVRSLEEASRGFARLEAARLLKLVHDYDVDYIVLGASLEPVSGFPTVYADKYYRVQRTKAE